jgi:hypothetical protein
MKFLAFVMIGMTLVGCQRMAASSRAIREPEARRIASDFANEFLKDKTFEDADRTRHRYETFSPTTWRLAEQTNGRWVLHLDPPDGIYATVSMSTNGTEVRMESYGFAPK